MRNDGYIGDMGRTDYDDTFAENAELVFIVVRQESVLDRIFKALEEIHEIRTGTRF